MTGARISKHIRTAEKAKTPVMCVIGQKEADSGERLSAHVLTLPVRPLMLTLGTLQVSCLCARTTGETRARSRYRS